MPRYCASCLVDMESTELTGYHRPDATFFGQKQKCRINSALFRVRSGGGQLYFCVVQARFGGISTSVAGPFAIPRQSLHDGMLVNMQGIGIVNETLVERRQAPAFDVGVVLNRGLRTFAAGKSAEMKIPVWSLRELIVRGQIDVKSHTNPPTGAEKTIINETEDNYDVLWTGFRLEFFRDGGQSYWHTLVGEQQEIFVVCQDDEDGVFSPILVTADYDEAMAYHEADDTILSAPMPEKIYLVLERFVLENYSPAQKKRRKRKQWHGGEQDEAFARKPVAR